MADVGEIRKLMTGLEKAGSSAKIVEILAILDKDVKPTEKLLRETKLGIAVNKLRGHSDKAVGDMVKKIIKKWKEEVQRQKQSQGKKPSVVAESQSQTPEGPSGSGSPAKEDKKESITEKFKPSGKPRNAKNDGVRTDIYGDKVRDTCIDLCYTSLALDSDAPPADLLERAKAIEAVVFEGERGTSSAYKTKMRSLYMNLKDKANPMLRRRVMTGEVSAQRLYKMTPQEMASEELKEEIEKLEKKNLFLAQGATEKRATTDRFTCGKCKQKKVSYYQMQTRSADEPLTTFCTCENCGNRWKFS